MNQNKKMYLTLALALSTCGILFQNCAAAPPPDMSEFSSSSNSVGTFTCSFAGRVLLSGESAVAYQASSVPAGGICRAQTRTCNNGSLSGTYEFGGCTVQSPTGTASCNFYGQTIAHGQSVTAYQASSVSGGSCDSQTRTCVNGTLSGNYQYSSCVVDCVFNGAVVAHGANVVAYAAASGTTCTSQVRTCNQGNLSGSYAYSSCAVTPAGGGGTASCNFNGQVILHGASVAAYSTDMAPYGTTCAAYRQYRVCNDGVLSGSYPYSSCVRDFDACGLRSTDNFLQKSYSEAIANCP